MLRRVFKKLTSEQLQGVQFATRWLKDCGAIRHEFQHVAEDLVAFAEQTIEERQKGDGKTARTD